MDKVELLGGACFSHGPYTFYKAVRIGNGRVLRLGSFFLTKLWTDADLVSIGELQLLWLDSRGSNQPLASLRLYFLPENTPDGRRSTHGEDEVLTIPEKVVVRVNDLVTWLSPSVEWSYGREIAIPPSPSSSPENSPRKHDGAYPQILTDPGIDFSDVDKQQKEFETNATSTKKQDSFSLQPRVVVLSFPRYCRYRALLRRLEGTEPSWLGSSVAAALGGFTALPGTRVLFCRDTFDYPDLETHELLCNHLAPKLKGRPRRKRKKRSVSPGESSNESEASVASTSRGATPSSSLGPALRPPSSGVRRSERNTSAEEKRFLTDVNGFMSSRGTPVGKMPLLGYRQIDLFLFYTKVQKLGGYDSVSAGRLWKSIYDDIGGNTGSTSAATITRRHYERLLLPYERHQKGEETKVRPAHGRRTKSGSLSEDSSDVKPEIGRTSTSETPPPSEPPTAASPVPPLQSILSSSPFLPGDKPKTETGKTSSLRSVRVKPERLKSLNTIIANSTPVVVNQNSQLPSPSPPPSSNTSTNTSTSNTPSNTPSTTPTIGVPAAGVQSVLERQLNSPLMSQQLPPSTSPLPTVTTVTTNATSIIATLTPPPEKDMKDLKIDPKPTTLLAQGKENIPLFGENPVYPEKTVSGPKSPEIIDLEMENDSSRDKIIVPSFKKRKLEILREGGLEVTAVDAESRPSVIQATITPITSSQPLKTDETKIVGNFSTSGTANTVPKLISVTVTPDIGHMLPSPQDSEDSSPRRSTAAKTSNDSNANRTNDDCRSMVDNNGNNSAGSRVINVGSPNNANLLQLYANAATASTISSPVNNRFSTSTNDAVAALPKVTQSRSIFANAGEKMVYGNPKDILIPQNYQRSTNSQSSNRSSSENSTAPSTGGVLDLTQKQTSERSFARPNLEIVRVPVVPRPAGFNYDPKNLTSEKISDARKTGFPGYGGMLDSRTMASNNLEITLVSPKIRGSRTSTPPGIRQPSVSPPDGRIHGNPGNPGNGGIVPVNASSGQSVTPRRQQNGKYTSRSEPVSPYASRKSNHPPHIPNVPNLHHLNNSAYSSRTSGLHHQPQQQQPPPQQPLQVFPEKRKTTVDPNNRHHHRRTIDPEKSSMLALQQQLQQRDIQQQQQQQQQQQKSVSQTRQTDTSRRQHVPHPTNQPTGFTTTPPQNSSGFLSQMPNSPNKFLPMIDPLYYSAIYNGLFPPPMTAAGNPYIPPEFTAYYKELLASTQPRIAVNGQHQPAVPTSK